MSRTREAVVRISLQTCDGDSMGSGFVVGDDEVMTAAHVVDHAQTISIRTDDGRIVRAKVVDYDSAADVALLRSDEALSGIDTFELRNNTPALGSELAVLGYPLWSNSLKVATGVVSSGSDEKADYGDQLVERVFWTDAATNGGNSGGPVIDHAGAVIGLVSGGRNWDDGTSESRVPAQGINFIVPSTEIAEHLQRWETSPTTDPELCPGENGDGADLEPEPTPIEVEVNANHPDADDLALTLHTLGEGINEGNYDASWVTYTPSMQAAMGGLEKWSSGLQSSVWTALTINSVARTRDTATVGGILRTQQNPEDGHEGQTCSIWDMTYTMVLIEGEWRIEKVKAPAPDAC